MCVHRLRKLEKVQKLRAPSLSHDDVHFTWKVVMHTKRCKLRPETNRNVIYAPNRVEKDKKLALIHKVNDFIVADRAPVFIVLQFGV